MNAITENKLTSLSHDRNIIIQHIKHIIDETPLTRAQAQEIVNYLMVSEEYMFDNLRATTYTYLTKLFQTPFRGLITIDEFMVSRFLSQVIEDGNSSEESDLRTQARNVLSTIYERWPNWHDRVGTELLITSYNDEAPILKHQETSNFFTKFRGALSDNPRVVESAIEWVLKTLDVDFDGIKSFSIKNPDDVANYKNWIQKLRQQPNVDKRERVYNALAAPVNILNRIADGDTFNTYDLTSLIASIQILRKNQGNLSMLTESLKKTKQDQ